MGLLDKLKDAANLVTGGAARVTIEYSQEMYRGDDIPVRVTTTSTGSAIKSDGVFVDLRAVETVNVPRGATAGMEHSVQSTHTSFEQEVRIAPAFTLGANETRVFEGVVRLPANAQPTFVGRYTQHEWSIRGRLEAKGNDPDSGFLVVHVD